jgi:hypothetical protein
MREVHARCVKFWRIAGEWLLSWAKIQGFWTISALAPAMLNGVAAKSRGKR